MTHDFQGSLAKSKARADAPWWEAVYREAFPDMAAMVNVRDDGWAQRGGIDRVITLASARTINIDEKVRDKNWPDILLEYWSDRDRRIPGWVAKSLACDFVAYAFVPSQTCYLLNFQMLRRAWRLNRGAWVREHQKVEARNSGYVTVSVAVPIQVIVSALGGATKITWQ